MRSAYSETYMTRVYGEQVACICFGYAWRQKEARKGNAQSSDKLIHQKQNKNKHGHPATGSTTYPTRPARENK